MSIELSGGTCNSVGYILPCAGCGTGRVQVDASTTAAVVEVCWSCRQRAGWDKPLPNERQRAGKGRRRMNYVSGAAELRIAELEAEVARLTKERDEYRKSDDENAEKVTQLYAENQKLRAVAEAARRLDTYVTQIASGGEGDDRWVEQYESSRVVTAFRDALAALAQGSGQEGATEK